DSALIPLIITCCHIYWTLTCISRAIASLSLSSSFLLAIVTSYPKVSETLPTGFSEGFNVFDFGSHFSVAHSQTTAANILFHNCLLVLLISDVVNAARSSILPLNL